jgi:hypothetical protein
VTYEQAVALRRHQLAGFYVDPEALAEAFEIIRTTRTPTPRVPLKHLKQPKDMEPLAAELDMDAIYRRRAC